MNWSNRAQTPCPIGGRRIGQNFFNCDFLISWKWRKTSRWRFRRSVKSQTWKASRLESKANLPPKSTHQSSRRRDSPRFESTAKGILEGITGSNKEDDKEDDKEKDDKEKKDGGLIPDLKNLLPFL